MKPVVLATVSDTVVNTVCIAPATRSRKFMVKAPLFVEYYTKGAYITAKLS
jgi:hypothetical protein